MIIDKIVTRLHIELSLKLSWNWQETTHITHTILSYSLNFYSLL